MYLDDQLVSISLENTFLSGVGDFEQYLEKGGKSLQKLLSMSKEDGMGWLSYPTSISQQELQRQVAVAQQLLSTCDTIVAIGVGGSYMGARAILSSLSPLFPEKENATPEVIFAGMYLSAAATEQLLHYLHNRSFGLVVISKSGNTLEPSITFHLLKRLLLERYGTAARQRIVAITDPQKGSLRQSAEENGWTTLAIPPSIGGRFSALTPAGLFPALLGGVDVEALLAGAATMQQKLLQKGATPEDNVATLYAATRQYLYQKEGKKIELLTSFDPFLSTLGEWWKQLFAESEGKEGKGIFVATATFTQDLHSIGQWIQQGERTIFETILSTKERGAPLQIPQIEEPNSPHRFLSGVDYSSLEECAERGTIAAHVEGGVPVILLTIPERNAYYMGALLYFFELAVAISGTILGVNPFDQPGVEAYKTRMYSLLKKAPDKND